MPLAGATAAAGALFSRGGRAGGSEPALRRASYATVLAWGRGLEGQTGVEGGPASAAVVTRPTAILDLHGRQIAALAAGRLSSCALTASGEAYTWGDGRTGLLGHGSGRASLRVPTPQRVEALFGRASVAAAALGDAHALFVSEDGAALACGENKEGQLGLGTPLEVLAAQHRRALGAAGGGYGGAGGGAGGARLIREAALAAIRGNGRPAMPLSAAWTSSSSSSSGGGAGGLRRGGGAFSSSTPPHQQQQQQQQQTSLRELLYAGRASGGGGSSSSSSSPFWAGAGGSGSGIGGANGAPSPFGAPSPLHAGWAGVGASARRGGGGGGSGGGPFGGNSGGGSAFAPSLSAAELGGGGGVGAGWDSGLAPGQVGTPVRVGSDAHALWGDDDADSDEGELLAGPSSSSASSSSSSLLTERVVAASASRYCSALLTARGEVWTFGSDFNGALGSAAGATWQPGPRRVGGALGQAIADGGGAVAVATGGGFVAALTREGGVLVWGGIGGGGGGPGVGEEANRAGGQQQQQQQQKRRGGGGAARGNRAASSPSSSSPVSVRPVPGAAMPAWALGPGGTSPIRFAAIAAGQRHLLLADADGRVWAVGSWLDARGRGAGAAPVVRPKLLLDLGCEGGVARLAAGPHAGAVVSGDGRLYLWGRLVDRGVAEDAWRAAEAAAVAAAHSSSSAGGGADAWAALALQRQRVAADFAWPGFGGDRPRLVPELTGVRDVALGGHHALALVD